MDFILALLRGARCQLGREFPSSLERDDRQQLHGLAAGVPAGLWPSGSEGRLWQAQRAWAARCQGEESGRALATREQKQLCSVSATGRAFRKSGFVVEDKHELR